MKAYKKSTFHKLYLIEPELYNKVLPLLNELDKNELLQLNQKHYEEEMGIEENIQNNLENVESPSYQEDQINVVSKPLLQTNLDYIESRQPSIQENEIVDDIIPNSSPQYSSEYYPINTKNVNLKSSNQRKRAKKFLCQKCTKAFTTKFSLKRHNKNFHTFQNNQSSSQKDHLQFHENEPVTNNAGTNQSNQGIKRKLKSTYNNSQNKRLKPTQGMKRKQDDDDDLETDATDFKQPRLETSVMGLEDFSAPRGIKRRINRATDSEPRKKTRWIDFY